MKKNFEFDNNGHIISYENEYGATVVDRDYLAEKQAKAIAKKFEREEPRQFQTTTVVNTIVDISKDNNGKVVPKELVKNTLIWIVISLSTFFGVILGIVGFVWLILKLGGKL